MNSRPVDNSDLSVGLLGLRAAWGVFAHELVLQVKNRMLVLAIVATFMWVLFFGWFMAAQAQPVRGLRVAVAHPGLEATLALSEYLTVAGFPDSVLAQQAVRRGEALAAVTLGPDGRVELMLDDSQAAAARAIQGAIMAALVAAADQPLPEGPLGPALLVREAWGLGMEAPGYLLRVLGPGFVPVSALMLAFTAGGFALLAEKTRKTIFLFALSPASRPWLLLGKLVANLLLIVLVGALMVPLVVRWIGVPLAGSLGALMASQLLGGAGLLGLCYALSSLPVVKDETSLRMMIGVPVMMPMMMLSGIMYPLPLLPGWLQQAAGWLPMTWMMEAARVTFYRGGGLAELVPELLRLGAFAVAAVLLAIGSLGRLLRSQT